MEEQLRTRILSLKEEKNAVILAHYYAPPEVQAIADYVGDSFYLAKVAKSCTHDVIVFCGVAFMGESAKLLNPDKTVLMPDLSADCPMAHMVAPGRIAELRAKYDDLAVVCYINSTTALKAESDVCVTSSNAVRIVRSLPNKNVFFIPDRNLGAFVAKEVPEKNVILNDGCCPIHARISEAELRSARAEHPNAPVLSHPECEPGILALSDFIGSTADIIAEAKRNPSKEFIVCTEDGVAAKLLSDGPDKHFYFPKTRPVCIDMKRNTPEALLHVLEMGENEVHVSDELRRKALRPLDRMLELAK